MCIYIYIYICIYFLFYKYVIAPSTLMVTVLLKKTTNLILEVVRFLDVRIANVRRLDFQCPPLAIQSFAVHIANAQRSYFQ